MRSNRRRNQQQLHSQQFTSIPVDQRKNVPSFWTKTANLNDKLYPFLRGVELILSNLSSFTDKLDEYLPSSPWIKVTCKVCTNLISPLLRLIADIIKSIETDSDLIENKLPVTLSFFDAGLSLISFVFYLGSKKEPYLIMPANILLGVAFALNTYRNHLKSNQRISEIEAHVDAQAKKSMILKLC
jgi:hypothetical protein